MALTIVGAAAGRSQDSLCEASEVHNEIWQMLLVTHSFLAWLQARLCFKKSEDESSTACSDGFREYVRQRRHRAVRLWHHATAIDTHYTIRLDFISLNQNKHTGAMS